MLHRALRDTAKARRALLKKHQQSAGRHTFCLNTLQVTWVIFAQEESQPLRLILVSFCLPEMSGSRCPVSSLSPASPGKQCCRTRLPPERLKHKSNECVIWCLRCCSLTALHYAFAFYLLLPDSYP